MVRSWFEWLHWASGKTRVPAVSSHNSLALGVWRGKSRHGMTRRKALRIPQAVLAVVFCRNFQNHLDKTFIRCRGVRLDPTKPKTRHSEGFQHPHHILVYALYKTHGHCTSRRLILQITECIYTLHILVRIKLIFHYPRHESI